METEITNDVVGPFTTEAEVVKGQNEAQIVPIYSTLNPFLQMYSLQPTGIRIILNTPILGSDKAALFFVTINPLIVNPLMCSFWNYPPQYYGNLFPVNPDAINSRYQAANAIVMDSESTTKISIYQYGPEPLLSMMSRSYSKWSGSMIFALRSISNFTHQGNLVAMTTGPTTQTHVDYTNGALHTQKHRPRTNLPSKWLNSLQPAGYGESDVAVQRHMQFMVPYELDVPFVNQSSYMDYAGRVGTDEISASSYVQAMQYLALYAKGPIGSGGDNQVVYELEYAAGPDFQFYDYIGLDHFATERDSEALVANLKKDDTWTFPSDTVLNNGTGWYLSTKDNKVRDHSFTPTAMLREEARWRRTRIEKNFNVRDVPNSTMLKKLYIEKASRHETAYQ